MNLNTIYKNLINQDQKSKAIKKYVVKLQGKICKLIFSFSFKVIKYNACFL